MNRRIEELKRRVREGERQALRKGEPINILPECEAENLSWMKRVARLTVRQCEAETVRVEPDEQIVFTRTLPAEIPCIYSREDWERLTTGRTIHELGPVNNVTADWGKTLAMGLVGRRKVALASRERYRDNLESVEFLDSAIETIDAVLALASRYAEAARQMNREEVADILDHVPANPPRTFQEALQLLHWKENKEGLERLNTILVR